MGRELPPDEVLAADQRICWWAGELKAAGQEGLIFDGRERSTDHQPNTLARTTGELALAAEIALQRHRKPVDAARLKLRTVPE